MKLLAFMLQCFGLSLVAIILVYVLVYMIISLGKVLWEELKK